MEKPENAGRMTRPQAATSTMDTDCLLLDVRIEGVAAALPKPALDWRGYEMKAFEDSLDAVMCAWVGTCVVESKARPYGDMESAIWIPEVSVD